MRRTQGRRWRWSLLVVAASLTCSAAGCGASRTQRQADALLERGRYTEAMTLYRRELGESPQNRRAAARLDEAKRLESERLRTMGEVRLQDRDPARAFDLFTDATRYDPSNSLAQESLQRARDALVALAAESEGEGRVNEALAIHERILREDRSFAPSSEAIDRIHRRQAEALQQAGSVYLERGLPGNALVEFLKAQRSLPGDPTLNALISQSVTLLRERAHFDVVVQTGKRVSLSADAWARGIDVLLHTEGLPLAASAQPVTGPELVLELSGAFSRLSRATQKKTGTLPVPAGSRRNPNPEYLALKVLVDEAETRLRAAEAPVHEAQVRLAELIQDRNRRGGGPAGPEEEAQRKFIAELNRPVQQAGEEHQRLSLKLAVLPDAIEEQVMRTESYPTTETRLSMSLTAEVVFKVRDDKVLERLSIREVASVSDEAHPALPATRTRPAMPEDRLELPTEAALHEELLQRAYQKVAERCRERYKEHLSQQWADARRLAVAGKSEEAVEGFLVAWLSDPRRPPDEALRYVLDTRRVPGLPLLETLKDPPAPSPTARQE